MQTLQLTLTFWYRLDISWYRTGHNLVYSNNIDGVSYTSLKSTYYILISVRFSFALDWPNDSLLFDSYRSYLAHAVACPISQALSLLELLTLFQWKEQGSGSLSPAGVTRRWHSQLCAPQSGQSEVKYCSRMQTQEDNSDLQYTLFPC